jgi:hypothetical protein
VVRKELAPRQPSILIFDFGPLADVVAYLICAAVALFISFWVFRAFARSSRIAFACAIAVSLAVFAIRYGLEWAVVSPAKEARQRAVEARDRALQRESEIEASSREPFREGNSTRLANLLAEAQARIRKAVVILSKGYRPGRPCNREWGNWEQVDLEVGLEIKEPGLYAFSLGREVDGSPAGSRDPVLKGSPAAQQLAAGRYVLSWPVGKGEVGGCFVKGGTREFTLEIVRWAC